MLQYDDDDNYLLDLRLFNESLKGYLIEGDVDELYNVVVSNAHICVHLRDINLSLSATATNYIRIGIGTTLADAYRAGYIKGHSCKLIFIYFSIEKLTVHEINSFIKGIGCDVIFGICYDRTISSGIKLVMIFN